jgi:hypothetical protein
MDDVTRHSLIQLLGLAMNELSEEAYSAGWLGGTEYFVPELCRRAVETGVTQRWGRWEVTPAFARGLVHVSEQTGCWANLDESATRYVAFQPFPIPVEYLEALDREQSTS